MLNKDCLTYAGNLVSLKIIAAQCNYKFVQANICGRMVLDYHIVRFKPDAIIQLAVDSHVDRSIFASEKFMQTNIIGTYTLLESTRAYWSTLSSFAHNSFRFLHGSTDEVYGSLSEKGLFREDTTHNPSSPYSSSKAVPDHIVMAWHRTYGLPTLITNCSNNYGLYQFP
ncbi:MAG TPA: dTDP-glucose 4,6-dehydratase 2 [Hyphomicrobiaceae bacterium MAG_BT-2024]